MLRPRLPRIGLALRSFRRSIHNVPPLSHNFTEGVPGLLSPAGFDMAWTQYQSLMCQKLTDLTAGGPWENSPTKDVAIYYSRDPNSAPIFNYASMAHNNHFFFKCLSPNPPEMPLALKEELEKSFGSTETLRREMVVTASSMFGPGFVWLVKDRSRKYKILCTYLAGSPYPGAHYRRQPVDVNTGEGSGTEAYKRMASGAPTNTVGAHGVHASSPKLAPGGIDITPVLCINTWEHVYLPDYGIGANGAGGKREFAESWWYSVDWNVVATNADIKSGMTMVR
ncbi:manganese and iron superoxide dismutase [Acephala macrosclerotiorum]|nr:manganese and iron superoxide dismutase [Acephala macrosclerotiorum]